MKQSALSSQSNERAIRNAGTSAQGEGPKVRNHPYLRAYMAGITVPTMFLLVVLSVVVSLRRFFDLPVPLEHFVVFPMAVVPNAWGAWNMLRLASATARRLPLGRYGALLALLLPLLGYGVARALGFEPPAFPSRVLAVGWVVAIMVYYLVWKHLVGFLNRLLGVYG